MNAYPPPPGYPPPPAHEPYRAPQSRHTKLSDLSWADQEHERQRAHQLDRVARRAGVALAVAGALVVGVVSVAANYEPPDPACYPLPCDPGLGIDGQSRDATNQFAPAPAPTLPDVGGTDGRFEPYGSANESIPRDTTPYGRSSSSDGMGR